MGQKLWRTKLLKFLFKVKVHEKRIFENMYPLNVKLFNKKRILSQILKPSWMCIFRAKTFSFYLTEYCLVHKTKINNIFNFVSFMSGNKFPLINVHPFYCTHTRPVTNNPADIFNRKRVICDRYVVGSNSSAIENVYWGPTYVCVWVCVCVRVYVFV